MRQINSRAVGLRNPHYPATIGLIQSVSQALWPGLRAWIEVVGIVPSLRSRAFLPLPISI